MERETGTFTQERERVEAVKREEERAMFAAAGGSVTEALLGAGAVVLSILGLLNIMPQYMASVAVIALGAALLIGGAALASRAARAMTTAERFTPTTEAVQGALAFQALTGATGIVLGIIALLGNVPATLLAIGIIVLGAGFLLASNVTARVNAFLSRTSGRTETAFAAPGMEVIVGLGAVVLGILALAGFSPAILILASTLSLGAGILLSGSTIAGKAMSMLAR